MIMHDKDMPYFCSSSTTKFDSGSGWPSFFDAVLDDEGNPNVDRHRDDSHGLHRIEVTCKAVSTDLSVSLR